MAGMCGKNKFALFFALPAPLHLNAAGIKIPADQRREPRRAYLCMVMKKGFLRLLLALVLLAAAPALQAQCSVCTKTAQQLGEKPAKGLNAGIIYLMATPLTIIGLLGYRWWRTESSKGDA
jgi:hypothetical protein